MEHIVIIGNGIAGITTARHIRKQSNKRITIVSAESEYFYSRTALMYVYMGHMPFAQTQPYENDFWAKNKFDLKHTLVTGIDTDAKQIVLKGGEKMAYDKLVLATGSVSNTYDWPGQDLNGVLGMVNKQDLEKLQELTPGTTHAVIVGGGLIGIEMAEMLHARGIHVTMLVREKSFWNNVLPYGESQIINNHIREHNIELLLGEELQQIVADANGRAKVVITKSGKEIPCQVVGLTAGVSPNLQLVKSTQIETDKGILVNRFLETNVPDVYAIGDCAQQREPIGNRKPVEAVWYTGRMMGEALAETLCGKRTPYAPGNWFNSAKFLDVEYQTYGWVWSKPKEGETHFHWKHPNAHKCITIAYDTSSRKFLGINTLGIRLRHTFFDDALNNSLSVDAVVNSLAAANFDPEFYRRHEAEIQAAFSQHKNQIA